MKIPQSMQYLHGDWIVRSFPEHHPAIERTEIGLSSSGSGPVFASVNGLGAWKKLTSSRNSPRYENLEAARSGVFKYIETFYNSHTLHQTLGYLSPDQFEAQEITAPPLKPDHAPAIAA